MNNHKSLCLLIILLSSFTGCSIGPEKRESPAVFDLGPQRAVPAAVARVNATLLIPVASATPMLDSLNIIYRLNYRDAGRPEAYLENRWAASPAVMLTDRLRARFASAARGVVSVQDGARTDYALRVELEDFSQSFDTPEASKVVVRLRASLVNQETRALHAQRTFAVERSAAPNAPGAAKALSEASDAVVDEVLQWAAGNIK
jgi:cholesterol transport system auxiliary component